MRKLLIPAILILTVAFLVRLPYLTREFVLEEGLHIKVVEGVLKTGYPYVYLGEQEPGSIFVDRAPVLFFLIASSFKLFGESELTARLVPMLFSLAEIFIVVYFTNSIFTRKQSKLVAIVAGLFLALHPYVIQNSLQIHFDGIFSFFSTFFLLLSLNKIVKKQNSWKDHLQLAIVLFFAFSLKYEASLISVLIVLFFALFFYRKFLTIFFIFSLSSIGCFFGIFYLYNLWFGHSDLFWVPISRVLWVFEKILIPKFTSIEASTKSRKLWADNYYLLIRFLSWLSIPTILLLFFSFLEIIKSKVITKNPQVVFLFLWIFIFSGIYILGGWAGDYPRYFAPVMPGISILIGLAVVNTLYKLQNGINLRAILLIGLLSVLILIITKSSGFLFLDHITGWVPKLQNPFFVILLSGMLFITLARTKIIPSYLMLFLIFLNLGQIFFQNLHNLATPYSLTNLYGYGGYRESGQFLKQHFSNQDVVYIFDPIGYYFQGKYYDHYQIWAHPQRYPVAIKAFTSKTIAAVALPALTIDELKAIFRSYNLDLDQYLMENFKNHKNIGGKSGIEIWY